MSIYDFNRTFGKLPVLDQNGSGTCWYHQWAIHLRAFGLIYDHKTYTIDPKDLQFSPNGECGTRFAAGNRTFDTTNGSGCKAGYWPTPLTREAITHALLTNGIMQANVPSRAPGFARCWGPRILGRHRKRHVLPIIRPADSGPAIIDHSALIVGLAKRGPILQNSWGLRWGKDGRAILSWAFIERYGVTFQVDTYADHPLDGLNLG